MVSASANGASEVPGSSRGASWGHPCGPRGPKRFPSPVPDPGRGPSRPWEPGTRCVCEIGVLLARPRTRVLRSGVTASEPKLGACLGLSRLLVARAFSARLFNARR